MKLAVNARAYCYTGLILLLMQATSACTSDGPGSGVQSMITAGSAAVPPTAVAGANAAPGITGSVPPRAVAGAPASVGAAGRPAVPPPASGPAPIAGVGATPPVPVAGAGPAGAGGSAGAPAAPPSETTPTDGPGPKIPEVQGECPVFEDGSIMVAGHGDIVITAGEAKGGGAILFYWHGTGSSPAEAARLPAAVRDDLVASGGILAAFNGNASSGSAGDCSGTGAHNMADFEAADQIVACGVKNHMIDPRRIYTAGCSAGGLQSGCMAQQRSSYLAAAAPNSGGVVTNQMWEDDHSPAIMTMHGGASDMVIVTFSQTSATLDMNAKAHGSFVVNCDHGGGHCAASDELKIAYWQFMKDHPFGFTKSPWETAIPAGVPDYCKVY
jgi:Prolyl oligopeptidase family